MAQTYTRQSSFANGDTVTAALFNNEYNQLVNAFAYSSSSASSTGHRHDGTAGQGGNIHTIGDLDFLNKIVVDDTNNRWGVFVEVSSAAVEQIRIQDGAIVPVTDSDIDLGTTGVRFKDAYIDSVTTTGNVAVGGNLTVTGTTTFNGGTITMGDAATDNVVFGADVDSNIIPDDDDSYDLGSSSQEWRNLFIDGTANIDSLVADTADINGGTVDGAIIGGSSAAAITGTTITGTSFVIGSADINEAELETIDGVTAGTVAASKAIVVDSNKDFTGARNITLTGELDAGSLDVSGDVDVDGTLETDALSINGTAVTSTAAELNILDGVTSTAAELNILDGVTSTASEINILDGVTSTAAELNILDGVTASATDINLIDGITNGTVIASKAIITDSNKDITGGRNITISGELDAGSLDISGDADIDGTLEADAITIGGITLAETISDTVGAMVSSNTETNIAVTYQDSDNTLDFALPAALEITTSVGVGGGSTNGIVLSQGAIKIKNGGTQSYVDFYCESSNAHYARLQAPAHSAFSGNIVATLPATTGTIALTSDNVASATTLATARTIGGTSFDGSANIAVALSATATALATARTIHGVSFDGTANIDLSEVVQDTVGAMFSSNTETGIAATYEDGDGTIDLVIGNDVIVNSMIADDAVANAQIADDAIDSAQIADGAIDTAHIANDQVTGDKLSNDITIANNLTVAGNLAVTGTTTQTGSVVSDSNFTGLLDENTGNSSDFGLYGKYVESSTTKYAGLFYDASTDNTFRLFTDTQTVPGTTVNTGATGYAAANLIAAGITGTTGTFSGDVNVDSGVLFADVSANRVGINQASPDVSLDLGANTDAVHMPVGTSAQRPGSPAAGYFRYNSDTSKFEGYTTEWGAIAGSGSGSGTNMDTNIFAGDGSDTTFTLSTAPDTENNLMVFIDGVFQAHNSYSVTGTTLTFSTAPANGRVITAYHSTTTVGGSNNTINTMTGDNSDTTLTLSVAPVHENNTQVYFDGVYQSKANYAISGTTLTFSTAPATGVLVEAITNTNTSSTTANQLLDADGDTMIQVEESSDEDKIRFDTGGTERMVLDSGSLTVTPKIVSDAGIDIDNFNIDGTTIALSSGDLTLDVAGDIILDADGADIMFKDGGLHFASIRRNGEDAVFKSIIQDKDVVFRGNDGGTEIVALTLDMSAAGKAVFGAGASFSSDVFMNANELYFADNGQARFGGDEDLKIYHDGSDSYIQDTGSGNLLIQFSDLYLSKDAGSSHSMVIRNSGNVGIGTTNPGDRLEVLNTLANHAAVNIKSTSAAATEYGISVSLTNSPNDGTRYFLACSDSSTTRAVIRSNGNLQNANNSYGQISDSKLKENIVDATDKLSDIKKVKVRNFNFIGSDLKQIGVVAQELETIFPSMVEETIDIDSDNNELETTTKSVKYSIFVPILVKAIQEQQTIIEDLKTRIETLEG